MNFTCKLCGEKTDNPHEHLKNRHHIDSWTYTKLILTRSDLQKQCVNCGSTRYLAGYGIPGIYTPCDCSENQATDILGKLKEIQEKTRKDNIYTGLICLKDSLSLGLSGNYDDLEDVIIKSFGKKTLGKNIYYGISILSGYPKEISKRNLEGIRVVPVKLDISKDLVITLDKYRFRILPLEKCGYDIRHHNRYSILSKPNKSTRYSKRIRLDGNICYKFWNNKKYPETKSIFKLVNPDTLEPIDLNTIPDQLLSLLKQVILRNKVTSNLLWSIYNEIVKYTKILDDQVLLKNTSFISDSSKIQTRISWIPQDTEIDGINLSIL